jgi:hypothetical protein
LGVSLGPPVRATGVEGKEKPARARAHSPADPIAATVLMAGVGVALIVERRRRRRVGEVLLSTLHVSFSCTPWPHITHTVKLWRRAVLDAGDVGGVACASLHDQLVFPGKGRHIRAIIPFITLPCYLHHMGAGVSYAIVWG